MNNDTMQPNGWFHFHKGHYLEDNVSKSLNRITNDGYSKIQCKDENAMDYLYTDAWIFLHGSCHLFALALHKEFGYEVYEIRDYDDYMRHVFCKATYRGQDVYIDVRGVTNDFSECMSDFQNMFYNSFYYGVYRIVARNLEEDMKLGDEGDMTGYLFAQSIIKKYRNFYDTSL